MKGCLMKSGLTGKYRFRAGYDLILLTTHGLHAESLQSVLAE